MMSWTIVKGHRPVTTTARCICGRPSRSCDACRIYCPLMCTCGQPYDNEHVEALVED